MKNSSRLRYFVATLCLSLIVYCSGCSKEEAVEQLKSTEKAAAKAADTVAEGAGKALEKGGDMASELGAEAMAFLSPLMEKLGNLENLKDEPAELKKAATELIETIENKSKDAKLPESMAGALEKVKEKLVALKDYLEGEVEQAKIDEHLKDIMSSVKSGLGMSE